MSFDKTGNQLSIESSTADEAN